MTLIIENNFLTNQLNFLTRFPIFKSLVCKYKTSLNVTSHGSEFLFNTNIPEILL